MTNDELEFLISQRLDGTLDAVEAAKLQHVLDSSADARATLASYEKLESALKATRQPVDVDAEWLSAQIAGRIDEEPERTFKLWHIGGPLAMVATLLIGLTLGVIFLRDDSTPITPEGPGNPIAAVTTIDLTGPTDDVSVTPAVSIASIDIGVPANLTPATISALYLSDTSATGRVSIRPAGRSDDGMFE